jgi:hypothetical protein
MTPVQFPPQALSLRHQPELLCMPSRSAGVLGGDWAAIAENTGGGAYCLSENLWLVFY